MVIFPCVLSETITDENRAAVTALSKKLGKYLKGVFVGPGDDFSSLLTDFSAVFVFLESGVKRKMK